MRECETCGGTGVCPACEILPDDEECPACLDTNDCPDCEGTGEVEDAK